MKHSASSQSVRTPLVLALVVVAFVIAGGIDGRAKVAELTQRIIRPAATPLEDTTIRRASHVSRSPHRQAVDCTVQRCIALTFDDGPNPVTTPIVLAALQRQKAHATFFVVGSRAAHEGAVLRQIHASGNEIGNHSWSHANMVDMNATQITEEVNRPQAAIAAAGVPLATLFRPPYGMVSSNMQNTVPMTLAMWNVDPLDWQERDPVRLKDKIVAQAKPGGVLDMHDIYLTTAQAIEPAIVELKRQGYYFVTYSQLFGLQPGQHGEYFGR